MAESLAGFISADRLLSFIYMVPSQRKSLAKAESWEGHGRVTIVAQRHSCEPVSVSSEAAESGAYGDDFYEPDAQYFALPAQNRFLH